MLEDLEKANAFGCRFRAFSAFRMLEDLESQRFGMYILSFIGLLGLWVSCVVLV